VILVDTGFLIALLSPRDELHKRATAWSAAANDPLLLTEYVLWEAVNHFSSPADRERAAVLMEWAESGEGCEFLRASPALLAAGWQLFRSRPDKAWSLTDCISFAIMSGREISKALAYDEHFAQAGFVALLRGEP
jgi:predicted nucleic acid-binding protein